MIALKLLMSRSYAIQKTPHPSLDYNSVGEHLKEGTKEHAKLAHFLRGAGFNSKARCSSSSGISLEVCLDRLRFLTNGKVPGHLLLPGRVELIAECRLRGFKLSLEGQNSHRNRKIATPGNVRENCKHSLLAGLADLTADFPPEEKQHHSVGLTSTRALNPPWQAGPARRQESLCRKHDQPEAGRRSLFLLTWTPQYFSS
jgi:hypothetical protein